MGHIHKNNEEGYQGTRFPRHYIVSEPTHLLSGVMPYQTSLGALRQHITKKAHPNKHPSSDTSHPVTATLVSTAPRQRKQDV